MDRSEFCGCKGTRTCLLCEEKFDLKDGQHLINETVKRLESYVYCIECKQIYPGANVYECENHLIHSSENARLIRGIYILQNFISDAEEQDLIQYLDSIPWDISQSGRRKQNFGPNCNFKKRKMKPGSFRGFPARTKFVQDRFESIPLLRNYKTIEQCSLEYSPHRGASIDPHIDDCWIWGERIVTVNLLSDSVLILTKYKGNKSRYNLNLAPTIEPSNDDDIVVKIPMPRRSLIILYNDARFNWEHCILREDIKSRRVCLAYREFTPPYLPGGENEAEGEPILKIAQNFWH